MTQALRAGCGKLSVRFQLMIALGLAALIAGGLFLGFMTDRVGPAAAKSTDPTKVDSGGFQPTPAQWATLTAEVVESRTFRAEHVTEGKITVDEDRSTPIFSLYAGRVARLLVAPGDTVERGQPLFVLEAGDSVQAQNDFIAAVTNLNKARAQVRLAETVERRLHNLYEAKAMPLKDWQEAEANLTAAQNDLRSAETALEANRNRLRLLGKSNAEIDTFQKSGAITADSIVHAPLSGTVVQRKVGPGQYVTAGSADPVFVIGDLKTVWLVAFVRESDASKVKIGQGMKFRVLAYPERVFDARINYVAAALDPTSRRLLVRATIDNAEGLLKPEMFASVTIVSGASTATAAVPRDAIIYEGDTARVWVAVDGKTLKARELKLGLSDGRLIQVLDGLQPGERIITRGSLFVDRMATGSSS